MTSWARSARSTSRFVGRTSSEVTSSSAEWGSVGSRPRGLPSPGRDEAGAANAEGGVGARVAEVPGELDAGDLDLEGGG